ncbi:MAG: hypothetical protein K6G80_06530 [Treponema sp.]|nr:hypothetical protein [Treponema sp.]
MRRLFFCALSGALFLFVSACSNSEPSVLSVTGSVVFDFQDAESAPASRLAVFVQTDTETQRADRITAVHADSGLSWQIDAPRMISGSDKNWAGYTNLQPAPGEAILKGVYTCQYVDAAGNEASAKVTVKYPDELLTATAETVRTCIQGAVTEYIALYSESGELMFFNKRRNSWHSNADIAKDYRNAYTMRSCLVTANNSIVCLLPPESLKEKSAAE